MRGMDEVAVYRVTTGGLWSRVDDVSVGMFHVPLESSGGVAKVFMDNERAPGLEYLTVLVCAGGLRGPSRFPTWEELCEVRAVFFREDDDVRFSEPVEFGVRKSPLVACLWVAAGEVDRASRQAGTQDAKEEGACAEIGEAKLREHLGHLMAQWKESADLIGDDAPGEARGHLVCARELAEVLAGDLDSIERW